ncbi:ring canal kelch homolog [Acyrthosiphon pisum]|uniref:Kelch-like protein diablo n=1 Tax=Acyrthosiphon pisum TaxID=7029 RepID=A0A8R2B4R7_ACYPI|nr:ring canal kelch homolog [Acyrthosiphon pisum]XP_016658813.1 ring canal kelch homolog [Acyrthosiphon pisum]|eukprot:XP_008181656.1 PREDICTED: ring canal kelch homolog [Acyrthosiphon pisum]
MLPHRTSVNEMDSVKQVMPRINGQKRVLKSNGCKPKIFINSCHTRSSFEVLQSLRREEVLCDIKLETDDGVLVCAHKLVLVAACPYFRAMFSSFAEGAKYVVNIRELDSNILQLLIDYIYTGKITVTEQNIMDLLPSAVRLQLDYVKDVCVEFLQKQLNTENCLGIRELADFYNCMDLLSSSEEYIKTHFLKVVEAEEFLSLSSEEIINLISRADINIPFEEKIFECVINWVKHELDCRYDSLPKLMEHVRLSLAPSDFISKYVVDEPLIKNNPKCIEFVIEALNFHIVQIHRNITLPQKIRYSPRQTGLKFLLAMESGMGKCYTSWYDPATKLLYKTIEMSMQFGGGCHLALIKEHLVFALGNKYINSRSIELLDLSSHPLQWKPTVNMLVDRNFFGVGVLDDRIYAVGGAIGVSPLSSVEVFDVGGHNYISSLKSVECYDPSLDTWTPVTHMSTSRRSPGLGVLDGVIYAAGGMFRDYTNKVILKSVEAYTPIA